MNKWDKYLDDYNNYTKQYIKHYKKSLSGDTYSLSTYPYMKLRPEVLSKILDDAQRRFSLNKKQYK